MKATLDTSLPIATDVEPLEGELAISAASLAVLHFGVLVTVEPAMRAERLRRPPLLQRTFDALPLDDDVATSYGQLAAAVVAGGRQPNARLMDILSRRPPTLTQPGSTPETLQTWPGSTTSSKSCRPDRLWRSGRIPALPIRGDAFLGQGAYCLVRHAEPAVVLRARFAHLKAAKGLPSHGTPATLLA